MEKSTAFWEATIAICPVLALAVIVEIRALQWHRFSPLNRYALGFYAGLVLTALGMALVTALGILMLWDTGRQLASWEPVLVYSSIYFAVIGVIILPVIQVTAVAFADFHPYILWQLLKIHFLDRRHEKMLKKSWGQVEDLMNFRQEILLSVADHVFARPDAAFVAEGEKTKVCITDSVLAKKREAIAEIDLLIIDWKKSHKSLKRNFRSQQKEMIRKAGRIRNAS